MDNPIEKMYRKLSLPIPMKGVERKIYSCIILLIILGVIWSIEENSWAYLDKSGSAIIIVGIWFTFRDFATTTGKYGDAKRKELLALISKYESVSPQGIINTAMHNGNIENMKHDEMEFTGLIKLMIKRLRITEATILILGTFLNGYGSVIFQYIWPLKNA